MAGNGTAFTGHFGCGQFNPCPHNPTQMLYARSFLTRTDPYRPSPGGPRPQFVLPSTKNSHAGSPTARSSISAPRAAAITLRPGAMGGRNCQIHREHLSPPSKADRITTPVSPTVLRQLLVGYDPASTNYLVKGSQSGFAIGCFNVPSQTEVPNNLPSATQYPGIIESKIVKELAAGRIIGPLSSPPAIDKYRNSG